MTPSPSTGARQRRAEHISLDEYEEREVSLPTDAARDLQELAAHRIGLRANRHSDSWTLSASHFVGTLVTPDVEVLIRPKISLENLFLLLDVDLPKRLWSDLSFGYDETPDDLLVACAELFARQAEHTLATGVLRAYREHRTHEVALRGRVDVNALVSWAALPTPVPCRYDELTVDIAENRCLKAAARRLLRVPGVLDETRTRLRRVVTALDGVADTSPRPEDLDRMHLTRLSRYYESALRLARLVLANLGLIDRPGANDAAAFLLDMNVLFQTWVTQRLRRFLRGRLTVEDRSPMHLGHPNLVRMYPDLLFKRGTEVVHVGDVKYKLVDAVLGRASDYYQLLAYATVTGTSSGVLIYCQRTGEVPPRDLIVRHGGQHLRTCALDLRGRRHQVEETMAEVAAWIEQAP
jgi:5-methylcytosine-specific restriction enzyme subunit McrC